MKREIRTMVARGKLQKIFRLLLGVPMLGPRENRSASQREQVYQS